MYVMYGVSSTLNSVRGGLQFDILGNATVIHFANQDTSLTEAYLIANNVKLKT